MESKMESRMESKMGSKMESKMESKWSPRESWGWVNWATLGTDCELETGNWGPGVWVLNYTLLPQLHGS